jgi:hypothetical protein
MSKRNAANFPVPTSSRHYTKPKTKAEEFVDYLKSLGYQLGKHHKPEHFEFLFQSQGTVDCVKFLMNNIKPANIVELDEMKQ